MKLELTDDQVNEWIRKTDDLNDIADRGRCYAPGCAYPSLVYEEDRGEICLVHLLLAMGASVDDGGDTA